MGGTEFKWGGGGHHCPPLATAMACKENFVSRQILLAVDSSGT